MNTRETNIILRQKVRTELTALRRKLLSKSQQFVLDHAKEYATKADIVMLISKTDFDLEEARAMLTKPRLLDALFKEYSKASNNNTDAIISFMKQKSEAFAAEYFDCVNGVG